ncbi:hypothetical protein ASD21_18485 [Caulobacter sp. Root1455]|uniref:hypothetical protein n=1 Tax=Caulobacter sp. Root1455 TaxID=1736465 RepID=UPI0006F1D4A9|nr:hypothetical protein [Caulobacter sp. Root1455]KQZ05972.1 hypothetical protein ASD21_18485 [Caulobacter sp. Root1455]
MPQKSKPRDSRLKVGVDVPWVTSWSDEESLGVRPCPTVGGRLAVCQAERPGLGKPQYSLNHFRRQRETVGRMLCPMCGEPTVAGDRWTQIAKRVPAGLLRAKGLGIALPPAVGNERIVIDAGSIAPLHDACVKRSLEHCPHLKAHPGVEVMAWPEHWTVAPLMVQAVAPPVLTIMAAPIAPPRAAVGFLQIFGLTQDSDPRWRRRLRELDLAGSEPHGLDQNRTAV